MSSFETLNKAVIEWGRDRGILEYSTPAGQFLKGVSETGELADALAKGDRDAIIDALGDELVTRILLAELLDLDLVGCLAQAYNVIASRKGKMVGEVFVKDENS